MKFFSAMFMIAMLIGGAYGTLLLFSRLSGVNMQAAMCWGIKTKYFGVVLFWCLLYLVVFVAVMILLHKPYTLWNMNRSHTGALLGYAMSDEEAKLYDPDKKQYMTYKVGSPPPAATRFSETFKVIALYRPFSSGPYQNIQHESLGASVITIFLAALFLILLYLVTYAMADLYMEKTGLTSELSHRRILDAFRHLTGYRFTVVLAVFALVIAVPTWIGAHMVNRITRAYEERFSPMQEDLRGEILTCVAPGERLKGMVINRVRDSYTIHGSRESPPPDDQDRTVHTATYTIEFRGLLKHEPVYLSIKYVGEPDAIPQRKRLDRLFPPGRPGLFETKRDWDPREMRDLDFLVEKDYSVSLVEESERR